MQKRKIADASSFISKIDSLEIITLIIIIQKLSNIVVKT